MRGEGAHVCGINGSRVPRGGEPLKTILLLFGTRPEVIKLAPVVRALDGRGPDLRTVTVSSSQHRELVPSFARTLGMRIDRDLDVMRPGQRPGEVCGRVLEALDPLLAELAPDLLVVQGDTTTALAGALGGFYAGIPVAHVEAGLRTGDRASPFPEEMNRSLITRLADLHLAPTRHARETLLREGVSEGRAVLTGNPVVDSLHAILQTPPTSAELVRLLEGLGDERILVVTTHRRENFGAVMAGHLRALRDFVEAHPEVVMVFPVHPNPAVREAARVELGGAERIHCIEPLEYSDFVHLLARAWLIVSDSGGVQEEAPTLRKPVLVLRDVTERPEAVKAGVARLVGHGAGRLRELLEEAHGDEAWFREIAGVENPFGTGDSGERIARAIETFLK